MIVSRPSPGIKACVCGVLILFAAGAQAQSEVKQRVARFKLYTACAPLDLIVESLHPDAGEIRLTKSAITTTVRSRLRAARIYNAEQTAYLYVNVNVAGRAYSINVSLNRWLTDPVHDTSGIATTWNSGSTGTHGGNSGYILQVIGEHMDRFIDQYLEINEPACE